MNVLQALAHLFQIAMAFWPWGRCVLLSAVERVTREIAVQALGELGLLSRLPSVKTTTNGYLRGQAWSLMTISGGSMELVLAAAAMILLFIGTWAIRRLVLPAPVRPRPSRTGRMRPARPRLVSSGENALARKAVTVACTGTTAELQSVVKALSRRAPLEVADAAVKSNRNDCPYCAGRVPAQDGE